MALSQRRVTLAVLSVMLVSVDAPRYAQGSQVAAIAVVVHPANPHERMTRALLCDILLGERQRWPNGSLIDVAVPPAGSQEWRAVLRAACRMSEAGFSRQVASSRAFGRASRPPQVVATASEMKQRVATSHRAIGFVAVPELDSTVKALVIDGKRPTDAGYAIPLTAETPP